VRERAVLLESLVLIRIYNRDPGPHILVKQRNSRYSGGDDTFFGGNGLPFIFRSPLLTVFKSFIPFGNFFT
jgi:hypothetical protein